MYGGQGLISHERPDIASIRAMDDLPPRHLHLERDRGLDVEWTDGRRIHYPIAWLRRMSPSADARELRKEMDANPLTVLPTSAASGPLTATAIEPVGNYAIRIRFSDGHSSGIYSWQYLREIEPDRKPNPDQDGATE